MKNIKNFPTKFSIFTAKNSLFIAWASFRNVFLSLVRRLSVRKLQLSQRFTLLYFINLLLFFKYSLRVFELDEFFLLSISES